MTQYSGNAAHGQPITAVTTFAETWLAGPRFEPGGLSPTGLQSADGGSTDVAVWLLCRWPAMAIR